MLIPIVCTCGFPVGQFASVYRFWALRLAKEAAVRAGIAADALDLDAGAGVQMGEILDMLGVTKPCCRTAMMTAAIWVDYY